MVTDLQGRITPRGRRLHYRRDWASDAQIDSVSTLPSWLSVDSGTGSVQTNPPNYRLTTGANTNDTAKISGPSLDISASWITAIVFTLHGLKFSAGQDAAETNWVQLGIANDSTHTFGLRLFDSGTTGGQADWIGNQAATNKDGHTHINLITQGESTDVFARPRDVGIALYPQDDAAACYIGGQIAWFHQEADLYDKGAVTPYLRIMTGTGGAQYAEFSSVSLEWWGIE